VQAASEGLGGIRDVILDGTHHVFDERFGTVEAALRRAQASNAFFGAAPRFIVEALGIVLLAALTLLLSTRPGGLQNYLPVLGALALGAQRMVPLLQQIYAGWAAFMNQGASLGDLLAILKLPAPKSPHSGATAPLAFEREIALRGVAFRYPAADRHAVNDIELVIPRGARVGIVGKTGSGKSTLVDLLMGLLQPTQGVIEIDGRPLDDQSRRAWQKRIAHVPQAIFLSDGTIAENIAFGITATSVDPVRLRIAAQQAELADFIEGLPDGYETLVGERGVRLSGGQRQRIGIARALYKQADVLIFDEATSALDSKTESDVMKSIEALSSDLTIVIVAHRLSTLAFCSHIFDLAASPGAPGEAKLMAAQ
jgi:ATP-binding cassette subfamily B protein